MRLAFESSSAITIEFVSEHRDSSRLGAKQVSYQAEARPRLDKILF